MEKNYKVPAICWLKVTDYLHGWLQHELGGEARVRNQRVICIQHLPGAREILRQQAVEDMMGKKPLGSALSGTRRNCFAAGLDIDAETMEREYGVTAEVLKLFVPIECPKMCLTEHGVLRPWTLDVCLSKAQATALQRLLRGAFWDAVEEFDVRYARKHEGEKYPAVDMIEDFCKETNTPLSYADVIRREWQRRCKRRAERTEKED